MRGRTNFYPTYLTSQILIFASLKAEAKNGFSFRKPEFAENISQLGRRRNEKIGPSNL
ncbi:hypothetical protein AGR6A_pAt20064 [Agrobacterium sp. NCPPB 925]|nr:hypothetical protein AGR6A_pAt20064 [Agrobacterium sp. NCPPB 925]